MTSFSDFQLMPEVSASVDALGFSTPTPIQQKALPLALAGKDVIGIAETGSGKTAAFCLPLFTHLLQPQPELARPRQALILVPTRELAYQIDEFWQRLTTKKRQRSLVVIGGVSMGPQQKLLVAGPRVIIATPGRLIDHLQQRTADLSNISMLVLDEADRMLDMGFAPQLERIAKALPSQRQTLFFSATWDDTVDRLAKRYLRDAQRVVVGQRSATASTVSQSYSMVRNEDKNARLLAEIDAHQGSSLVFTRTKARCDRLTKFLLRAGISVAHIHGDRSQAQRTAALDKFRAGEVQVLVATDIAARGIDVSDIQHVYNYDLPMVAEDYVHRIGRTGRAGQTGTAVSLVCDEDKPLWQAIERLLEKTKSARPVALVPSPPSPRMEQATAPQPRREKSGPALHSGALQPAAAGPRSDGEKAFDRREQAGWKRSKPSPGPNAARKKSPRDHQKRFADLRNKEARQAPDHQQAKWNDKRVGGAVESRPGNGPRPGADRGRPGGGRPTRDSGGRVSENRGPGSQAHESSQATQGRPHSGARASRDANRGQRPQGPRSRPPR